MHGDHRGLRVRLAAQQLRMQDDVVADRAVDVLARRGVPLDDQVRRAAVLRGRERGHAETPLGCDAGAVVKPYSVWSGRVQVTLAGSGDKRVPRLERVAGEVELVGVAQ